MSIYRRFFVAPSCINGSEVDLTSEYQHIAKVLRMRCDDKIIVCCGDKMEHLCAITAINANSVTAEVLSSEVSANENSFSTTLYVGALKGDKMDLVVQKSVELGVNSIVLFDSKFSVGGTSENKLVRYNRIAVEACKQCGRAIVVGVSYGGNLDELTFSGSSLVCYERQTQYNLTKWSCDNNYPREINVVIGSEGGFSEGEIEKLSDKGCAVVTLGNRILRAETAPLYVLSALDTIYGELQ